MKIYRRNPHGRWMSKPASIAPECVASLHHSGVITFSNDNKQEPRFIIGSTGGLRGDDMRYYVDLDEGDLRNAIRAWSYNEKFREIVKEILG